MPRYVPYLEETRKGNSQAFNEVVMLFEQWALKRAYARLNDYFLSEEAVQEAFITAYLKLSSLRRLEAFPEWFRAILISSICKIIRKNHLNISFVQLDESKDIAALTATDLDVFEQRESRRLIRRAITSLPPKTMEVCRYFYLHGYSQKEIAHILNVPLGTVKRRLHDARKKLREYLKYGCTKATVQVGYLPISDHLLAMLSQHINEDDKLQIQLQKFLSWASLANAIRNRELDVAFVMASLAMTIRNEGIPIIYVLDAAHGGSALTVRNGIPALGALAGATLGLPVPNSTHSALLHLLLRNETISVGRDIAARYLGPSYNIRALRRHQIDGFFCAEPWNTKAVYEGVGRILIRSDQIDAGHICCIVVANEDFAAKHGDILQSYVMRLLAASDLVRKDPEKCSKIQAAYTGINPQIAEDVIRNRYVTFFDLEPNRERVSRTMNMARNAGTLEQCCNLDSFISTEFV